MFKDEVRAADRAERRNLVAAVRARTRDLRRRSKWIICFLSTAPGRVRAAPKSVRDDKGVKHEADFLQTSASESFQCVGKWS